MQKHNIQICQHNIEQSLAYRTVVAHNNGCNVWCFPHVEKVSLYVTFFNPQRMAKFSYFFETSFVKIIYCIHKKLNISKAVL